MKRCLLILGVLLLNGCSTSRQVPLGGFPPALEEELPSTSAASSNALAGSTAASAGRSGTSTGMQTATTAGRTQALTVAVHNSLDFSDDRVRAALAEASRLLRTTQSPEDQSAAVEFVLKGEVFRFGRGYPAELNSEDDYKKLTNIPAHVVVVARIGRCGGSTNGICGCAPVGGIRIHVGAWTAPELDGSLWAHELGHNAGLRELRSANEAQRVMFHQLGGDRQELTQQEASRFTSKDWDSPRPTPPAEEMALAEEMRPAVTDALDWINKRYVHGPPVDLLAAALTEEDQPALLALLKDPAQKEWWGNACTALGLIGSSTAREALWQFVYEGEGQIPLDLYNAKADALAALGYAANRDGDSTPSTLDLLGTALGGKGPTLRWTTVHAATEPEQRSALSSLAAQALAIAGGEQARALLQNASLTAVEGSSLAAVLEESLRMMQPL
jgi:hypothetical protein